MLNKLIVTAALTSVAALTPLDAFAARATVRGMRVTEIAAPETSHRELPRPQRIESNGVEDATPATNDTNNAAPLVVYPVAGEQGREWGLVYYVDLDPNRGSKIDFNCGDLTFDGHTGHDPYIRSFREQEIGVPVFAVRDGIVSDVHDGENDMRTDGDPTAQANYITLVHAPDEFTLYVHLRKNSIPFKKGDVVTAGTQIGLVGSSGESRGPHIHFETQVASRPVEPMAGPCRPGPSLFREQHGPAPSAMVIGTTISEAPFEGQADTPFDHATRTGTLLRGQRTFYFRTEMVDISGGSRYRLRLRAPNSNSFFDVGSGTIMSNAASFAAVSWTIAADLSQTGDWLLRLDVDGEQRAVVPFKVVATPQEVVNRPPNAITTAITPVGLKSGEVAVCHVVGDALADPDFEVVSYRYEWTVNGTNVRTVTSAARTDAIPRQYSTTGASISCKATAFDGRLSTESATAFATVGSAVARRRAIRK